MSRLPTKTLLSSTQNPSVLSETKENSNERKKFPFWKYEFLVLLIAIWLSWYLRQADLYISIAVFTIAFGIGTVLVVLANHPAKQKINALVRLTSKKEREATAQKKLKEEAYALALKLTEQKRFEEAIQVYRKIMQEYCSHPEVKPYFKMGEIYEKYLNDFEYAKKAYRRILAIAHSNPIVEDESLIYEARYRLNVLRQKPQDLEKVKLETLLREAKDHLKYGNLESALERFQEANRIDLTNVKALIGCGETLLKMDRPKEAIPWLSHALEIDSGEPRIDYFLAQIHEELSDTTAALQSWQRCLDKAIQKDRGPLIAQAKHARDRLKQSEELKLNELKNASGMLNELDALNAYEPKKELHQTTVFQNIEPSEPSNLSKSVSDLLKELDSIQNPHLHENPPHHATLQKTTVFRDEEMLAPQISKSNEAVHSINQNDPKPNPNEKNPETHHKPKEIPGFQTTTDDVEHEGERTGRNRSDLIGVKFGNYRIETSVGKGGHAEVFCAKHIHLDKLVAIKIMHPDLVAEEVFQKRFLQEARSIASLEHPNIVEIYDFGKQDDVLYILMEWMDGGSLRGWIDRLYSEQLPNASLKTGIRLLCQALGGLSIAHARGMIHRDIKPDNLLLKREQLLPSEPDRYVLKISDFGLVRWNEGGLHTTIGRLLGSPAYMSPEQCEAMTELDQRSDIYSIGIVLYELSTGKHPFQVNTPSGVIFKHIFETPIPPTEVAPHLPKDLEQIILKCLAKSPKDRYETVEDLIVVLEEICDGSIIP